MPEHELVLTPVGFDDPAAVPLIELVQQEYVVRYGGVDETPTDPAEFAPPHGLFLIGRWDGEPVACGGWRAHDCCDGEAFADGDAEVKRMYVAPSLRGRGFARAVLAELERTAAVAGRKRIVLETGTRQPEAIGLYLSSGYVPIPPFGVYRYEPGCLCYAKELA